MRPGGAGWLRRAGIPIILFGDGATGASDRMTGGGTPMAVQISRRLFSIDEYHRMAEAGDVRRFRRGETVAVEAFPDVMSPVDSILG